MTVMSGTDGLSEQEFRQRRADWLEIRPGISQPSWRRPDPGSSSCFPPIWVTGHWSRR
ncbi:hypothetical protein SVIOM342S_04736 [Streptomyces violaceorubidus]